MSGRGSAEPTTGWAGAMLEMLLLTAGAGLAIPAGALLARVEHIRPAWLETEFRHTVIAFGGGVLLSAVALVLVPEGLASLHWLAAAVVFVAGGLAFMWLDVVLSARRGSMSQLVAMLSDFVPEAISLGAAFVTGRSVGLLLALMIALQNLPEGFNAYRELRSSTRLPGRRIVWIFVALSGLGPVCGLVGYAALADRPAIVGGVMLFASAGILYLTFEDIAPQARLERRHAPPLGAVVGFLLGMIGHALIVGGHG